MSELVGYPAEGNPPSLSADLNKLAVALGAENLCVYVAGGVGLADGKIGCCKSFRKGSLHPFP